MDTTSAIHQLEGGLFLFGGLLCIFMLLIVAALYAIRDELRSQRRPVAPEGEKHAQDGDRARS